MMAGTVPGRELVGRTLIIGGSRSGKSLVAERLLALSSGVVYVATGAPMGEDSEWNARVQAHQERRPAHWRTVETIQLVPFLQATGPPLLIDCLALWLTGVMDRHKAWDDPGGFAGHEDAIQTEIDALVSAWQSTTRTVVGVTAEVGLGLVPGAAGIRRFRDLMGHLNARIAEASDEVLFCVAGRVITL